MRVTMNHVAVILLVVQATPVGVSVNNGQRDPEVI
jgi:hypothetical protein